MVGSNMLLAAFISWGPVSVLLALLTGAVLGRLRDDETQLAVARPDIETPKHR